MNINNSSINKFYPAYLIGFFLILALPLLAVSPLFFPPEWGKAIVFRIIFSSILFLFFWQIISNPKFSQQLIGRYNSQKKTIWMILAVLLMILLSTIFSSDIVFSLWTSPHRSGGSVNFIFHILFSVILFLTLKNDDWKKLWNFSFLIGDLIVAFAILQYFNVFPDFLVPYTGRPPSTLSNSILFTAYLMLLIFPALHFVIKKTGRHKIFHLASLLLFTFGIMIGGSRSAYLGILVGGFYFLFFYPIVKTEKPEGKNFFKKLPILRIITIALMLFAILGVYYANTHPKLPQFLEKNQIFQSVVNRLYISSVLEDPRFSTWKIALQALKEKPILGWGPENFAIGFDKYYDSTLPYLAKNPNEWWDRAHNIFLDLSVCNGLLFTIIYFSFFGILFFKLFKKRGDNAENKISSHAILSTFLGYFITLLFGFDSVSTYIVFFFIVGYSLYITSKDQSQNNNSKNFYYSFKKKNIVMAVLLLITAWFIWQYNLNPLFINSGINKADKLECRKKLSALEKLFSKKSFLDSYLRLTYTDHAKACMEADASMEADYINKTVEALKYAANARPFYTRTWLMLGSFNTVLFAAETDPELKKSLYEEINYDFNRALSLGPKHQKILSEWAKFYFAAGDYAKMKNLSEECVAINPDTNSCYWYLGLSEILLKDSKNGSEHLKTAIAKGFSYNNESAYNQLAIAYIQTQNYKELISVYKSLISLDYKNIQYHATLATVYKESGDYKNARQEALEILKIAPEAKDEANEFLRTLPY